LYLGIIDVPDILLFVVHKDLLLPKDGKIIHSYYFVSLIDIIFSRDPLTGLGAINFTRLAYVAAPRPVRSPTPFPTVSPDSPENELSMKVEQVKNSLLIFLMFVSNYAIIDYSWCEIGRF
jgi:hypothetical protein